MRATFVVRTSAFGGLDLSDSQMGLVLGPLAIALCGIGYRIAGGSNGLIMHSCVMLLADLVGFGYRQALR